MFRHICFQRLNFFRTSFVFKTNKHLHLIYNTKNKYIYWRFHLYKWNKNIFRPLYVGLGEITIILNQSNRKVDKWNFSEYYQIFGPLRSQLTRFHCITKTQCKSCTPLEVLLLFYSIRKLFARVRVFDNK